MQNRMAFFQQFFEDHNLRLTKNRSAILEWIVQHEDHFTAEDIQRWVLLHHLKIGRATIYRTLELLTRNNLLVRRDFSQSHSHYELIFNNEPHEHMICLHCGDIFEFKSPRMERLIRKEAGKEGFVIQFHNIKIYGRCAKCQK